MTIPFQALPSVDRILSDRRIQRLLDSYSRESLLELVRSELEEVRGAMTDGAEAPTFDALVQAIEEQAGLQWRPWPQHVINATGVILHTNLGRAPLSREATEAIEQAAAGYSNLELDVATGRRGSRQDYIARLLCQLTGAQAALVVNNNASAVLLGLAALAAGKEVIVSRGEAVEIGGGFRIPDVLRQSGATLVEVGTTNRTYVHDYEAAITERTAAIMAVHASNFRVVGFTHSPGLEELVELGRKRKIPVLHDLGSGCLLDTAELGLAHEPMAQESVRDGAGLTFFSGDKLLGGPQAGIIVGRQELVGVLSRHPLARAVRIDKLSMAGLVATLLHYVRGEVLCKVPIWQMISMTVEKAESRARDWNQELGGRAAVVPCLSTVGGGSLPGETIPSWALCIDAGEADGGAEALAKHLRQGAPPVVGRIEEEKVLLDARTVLPDEDEGFLQVVARALGQGHKS